MNVDDLSGDITGVEVEAPQTTADVIREAVERQRGGDQQRETPVARTDPASSAPQDGRQRDEQGRFAPQQDQPPAAKPPAAQRDRQPAAAQGAAAAIEQPQQVEQQVVRAPAGFSPAAKIAFETASPALREAIAKREAEVDAGFQKYAGVDKYVRMAESSGTNLTTALDNYVQIESVLRKDPVAGIERIAANMGVNPVSLAQAIINKHGNGGAPQQVPQQQNGQQRQAPAPQRPIDEAAVTARIMQQIQAQTAQTSIQSEIEAFKSNPENRFFDNVRSDMAAIMQADPRMTLKEGYDRACWAHPEIRAHLMKSQPGSVQQRAAAATQARSAAKAVTGAPGPGTRPGSAPPPNESTHDTVRRAVEEARGAV